MSDTFQEVKLDADFARKAAEKYQDRNALVADLQQWRSLSIMLREGLRQITKDATAGINKERKDLENARKRYDKESHKYAYQVSQIELEKIKAEIEAIKITLKQELETYYNIFGKNSDDYIVRDHGLNNDVKALQKSTKAVKVIFNIAISETELCYRLTDLLYLLLLCCLLFRISTI